MDKVILTQISACIAETMTYPIDYIKTHLQVNKGASIFNIIINNKKHLYNGLRPSLIRHCIYTTSRINIYEQFRNNDNTSFIYNFSVGAFSGGISQLISSPFDLLKINYITNPELNKNSIPTNFRNI